MFPRKFVERLFVWMSAFDGFFSSLDLPRKPPPRDSESGDRRIFVDISPRFSCTSDQWGLSTRSPTSSPWLPYAYWYSRRDPFAFRESRYAFVRRIRACRWRGSPNTSPPSCWTLSCSREKFAVLQRLFAYQNYLIRLMKRPYRRTLWPFSLSWKDAVRTINDLFNPPWLMKSTVFGWLKMSNCGDHLKTITWSANWGIFSPLKTKIMRYSRRVFSVPTNESRMRRGANFHRTFVPKAMNIVPFERGSLTKSSRFSGNGWNEEQCWPILITSDETENIHLVELLYYF